MIDFGIEIIWAVILHISLSHISHFWSRIESRNILINIMNNEHHKNEVDAFAFGLVWSYSAVTIGVLYLILSVYSIVSQCYCRLRCLPSDQWIEQKLNWIELNWIESNRIESKYSMFQRNLHSKKKALESSSSSILSSDIVDNIEKDKNANRFNTKLTRIINLHRRSVSYTHLTLPTNDLV